MVTQQFFYDPLDFVVTLQYDYKTSINSFKRYAITSIKMYHVAVAYFTDSFQWFNPLPALTPQSGRDLNVACSPKRSKAALLYSS
jgi:hypothetical protein